MLNALPNLLWTGNALEAREPRTLYAGEIVAVVDVAYEEPPASLPRDFIYCRFPLLDGKGNDPAVINLAVQTCVQLLQANKRTLIACSAGMSRSPTLAAFVLADLLKRRPEDLVTEFSKQRSLEIKPMLWQEFVATVASRH